ncbi:outer membrane protein [Granulicella rosea]|uniref:Outer membrane protein n=1 Tax=Granulicella rosea TaxID=474952 RepID=A0A239HGM7_9BACT|nr:TolC family protein [Granulicella rosea]SNS80301.1 outer membrane protein [Granulicella rosea]
MKGLTLIFILALPISALAQQNGTTLPSAPQPVSQMAFSSGVTQAPAQYPPSGGSASQQAPLVDPGTPATPITRSDAEQMALKNNPRITASHLLALAAGQVTRQTRSGELPQIYGAATAEKAEDGGRIGAGSLTDSRLYTHAGAGGTLSQLITDFGHTRDLVATNKLQQKAQDRTTIATEQDVLLAADEAFYRLLDAQSLLNVAKATVAARGDVQKLTSALTKSALKSDLDLNIASADLSQSQLLQLDAENAVASASAALAAVLAAPPDTLYQAVEDPQASLPPPPAPGSSPALNADAQAQRPDLQALRLNAQAYQKYARAQQLQHLPTISALATGGITPVAPDGIFTPNYYAAGGVNLTLPIFTGFHIEAQAEEARLRQKATEKQAQELSDTIARDVRIGILNAQTTFRRIAVADQFRDQTAQALALAQTRYKLGLSSIVELSQAQLQSTQAAVAAVNARYDYLLALRSLDYARGQLAP